MCGADTAGAPGEFPAGGAEGKRYISCGEANRMRDGSYARTAGMVPARQMPGTATWVLFITIEDESEGL